MKKTALYAFTLFLAASLGSCAGNTTADNNTATAPAAASESATATINIRYVDGDSIMANYNFAKDVQEFILKTHSKIDAAQQQRGTEIQRFAAQIEEKGRNNGYLSQESYNADMTRLQKMQQDAEAAIGSMQRSAAVGSTPSSSSSTIQSKTSSRSTTSRKATTLSSSRHRASTSTPTSTSPTR